MKKGVFNLFFCSLIILIFVLSTNFVLANTIATNVIFQGNVTPYYDEGVFTINWTAAGSAAANYTIYLWMDGHYVSTTANANTSATGYARSNITEANYTFTIGAVTAANSTITNATNVSMYVDRTAPLVNWTGSGYNNVTYKKNTDKLILNISVGDVRSGVGSGNSYCVFEINGTNESVAVSSGWCNTTQLNLTGLADGNNSIDIWANDTINNVGVNLSYYVVWIDTTAPPTPTFSCAPTSVYATETITCSCSGTDASSGVVSTSYTTNPSTSTTGTFDTSCTITDNAGNSANSLISYIVGGVRSIGSPVTSIWTSTYVVPDEQFNKGFTKELKVNNRVKIKIEGENHYVGLLELTETAAKIEVSSEPIQISLNSGEDARIDVNEDSFYDLYILLNFISNNYANLTVRGIHEEILEGEKSVLTTGEIGGESEEIAGNAEEEEKERNYWWIWVIVIVVLIVIFGDYLFLKKKKGKKKKS